MDQTNLPREHMTFSSRRSIYWLVEITGFNRAYGKLWLEVINYEIGDEIGFLNQSPKYDIFYLEFKNLHWKSLEPLLSSYRKSGLKNLLSPDGVEPHARYREQVVENMNYLKGLNFESYVDDNKTENSTSSVNQSGFANKPIVKDFAEEFMIDFEKCVFQLGYVECGVKSKQINQSINLKICNSFIRPEFDTIKPWFSKKLGKKRIKVIAHLKCVNYEIMECKGTSEDIILIDEQFIENIKIQRTQHLSKSLKPSESNTVLFTSEDVYSLIHEKEGNVFHQNEMEIIDVLMRSKGVRNKLELEYLSTNRQSIDHKIRFTTRPHFGFVFTVEGRGTTHFIWELLDSHATYIWTIDNEKLSNEGQYKLVEKEIERIFEIGRDEYKKVAKDSGATTALYFNVVQHKNEFRSSDKDYSKWMQKVSEILV